MKRSARKVKYRDAFYSKGNMDGNILGIRKIKSSNKDEELLYLKVSESCVYTVECIIPTTMLTSLLTSVLHFNKKENIKKMLRWDTGYNEELMLNYNEKVNCLCRDIVEMDWKK